ncbi:hypothetical protein [Mesorhizobium amorphae]|uniref:Glycosyltransferase RgtA/B/C/D-like domain-containing protein n=1 Tax=Mesorhizobium amorphae CCNWGS0123 TaxID=1082933 RepID=G6Y786_9HYPH|nr:hypothetical protein [Mesorhizobium amorphae]ANT49340.1 hypothetical protein A6B35_05000 [Mesorhizobium amorphae CCNWGS0123]EHH12388.1 hypothetical protein MEA186_09010 [Mesorhizobium amorphae CCNWGS0123]GLR40581.1 hypothetical protein GCM10007880_10970 [Mesorhizobium amorphae]
MSRAEPFDKPMAHTALATRPLWLTVVPLSLTLAVAAYAAWLALVVVPTNVDVSWLLVVCDRLLNGERLNVDLMEVNPPFSIWLYMPSMLLERLVGGRAELWLALGVIGAGLASLAISARILARADAAYRRPGALWALPAVLFVLLCFRPDEFGQREHFATIAILPWIALQCARQRAPGFAAGTGWEQVVAGVCAAIVVMVKPPHFALALALPAMCLAFQRRSLKPLFVIESIIGAAIVALYIAYVVIFQTTFLTEILPFLRDVYLPARAPFLTLLSTWPRLLLFFAAATVLLAGGFRQMHWDAKILLLAALGFVPAFLIMGKGWPNHALPMMVLGILAFGVQLLRTGDNGRVKPVSRLAAALGGFLILQTSAGIQRLFLTADNGALERTVASIQRTGPKPTITSLAARLQVAHPLARLVNGDFVSRYPAAWAVYNANLLAVSTEDPGQRHRLEAIRDDVIGQLASEIAVKKPDIVLYSAGTGPLWDALMLRDPRIALVLQQYEILHREPTVTVYVRSNRVSTLQAGTEHASR